MFKKAPRRKLWHLRFQHLEGDHVDQHQPDGAIKNLRMVFGFVECGKRKRSLFLKKTSASPRTRARVEMHCDSNLARSGYGRFSSLRQNQTWTT